MFLLLLFFPSRISNENHAMNGAEALTSPNGHEHPKRKFDMSRHSQRHIALRIAYLGAVERIFILNFYIIVLLIFLFHYYIICFIIILCISLPYYACHLIMAFYFIFLHNCTFWYFRIISRLLWPVWLSIFTCIRVARLRRNPPRCVQVNRCYFVLYFVTISLHCSFHYHIIYFISLYHCSSLSDVIWLF